MAKIGIPNCSRERRGGEQSAPPPPPAPAPAPSPAPQPAPAPCFSFPCCCSGQGAWLLEFVNCDVDFAPLQRCPGKNHLFITGDSSDHVTRRVTLHSADTQCLGKGVILCQIDIELTFTLLYCTCAHAQPPAKPNLQGCSTWTQFTVTVQTHCVLQMKCGVWVGRW